MTKTEQTATPAVAAGKIMLVGIGLGSAEHMMARARTAIAGADVVVGPVLCV